MFDHSTLILVVIGVVPVGCAGPVAVSQSELARLHRLAIVSRVEHGPTVTVARSEPGGLALFPGESDAKKVDQRIALAIDKRESRFQVAERLRAELMRDLASRPPWTQTVPAVEVASALETLLVEPKDEPPDFEALRQTGADSVLDIAVKDFGVARRNGKIGLYAVVVAHLFTLPGRDTLYRHTIDADDARDRQEELGTASLLGTDDYRDALEAMITRIGEALAVDLGGRRAPRGTEAPAGEAPTQAPGSSHSDN